MPIAKLADVITPETFSGYVQQITTEKTNIIQAGIVSRDAHLDSLLSGGGKVFHSPSFDDLDHDVEENIADDTSGDSTPNGITTLQEVQIRLSRNQSWGATDLSAALAGADPSTAIAGRVGGYWSQRLQRLFVATWRGIFAMNDATAAGAVPGGTTGDVSTHGKGDLTNNLAYKADGTKITFNAATTVFSGNAFIDTTLTMGDSLNELGLMIVHSVVYGRMQKQQLITFIPNARGEVNIPVYQGHRVIVDNGMPNNFNPDGTKATTSADDGWGTFETWMFGANTTRLGMGSPKVPTAVTRKEEANMGSGESVLFNRQELIMHPVGHAWENSQSASGGPTNAIISNKSNWIRTFKERNQIRVARLLTREYA